VVNMPQPLYFQEKDLEPTVCAGGLVGPRASLNGCENLAPTRI